MAEQQQVAEMWDNIYTEEEKQKMRNMLEKHWLPAVSNNILTQYEYSFKKWFEWTIISRKLSQAKEEFNKGIIHCCFTTNIRHSLIVN